MLRNEYVFAVSPIVLFIREWTTQIYRVVLIRCGTDQTHRALRDGSVIRSIPGNELPGIDHIVATRRAKAHAGVAAQKMGTGLTSHRIPLLREGILHGFHQSPITSHLSLFEVPGLFHGPFGFVLIQLQGLFKRGFAGYQTGDVLTDGGA
jgi:hypothetical protein